MNSLEHPLNEKFWCTLVSVNFLDTISIQFSLIGNIGGWLQDARSELIFSIVSVGILKLSPNTQST